MRDLLLAASLISVLPHGAADASLARHIQARPETIPKGMEWEWCFAPEPERKIAGCSAIIQLGGEAPENLATAYNARGTAHSGQGKYETAIRDFDEAIRLNPDDPGSFNNRGRAYAGLGQFSRAIQDYDAAIRINPYYARAYAARGAALQALGRPGSASEDFARAKRLDKGGAEPAH